MRIILVVLLSLFALAARAEDEPKLGIVAVVNDEIISSLDVEDRIRFLLATTGITDTPETRERLRIQVVRALVDETLQLQEAQEVGVNVAEGEIAQAVSSIEAQHQRPPGSLLRHLASQGVAEETFLRQLRAQIAWTKIVMSKIRPKVKISDGEVARAQEKEAGGERVRELRVAIISLPIDKPGEEQNTKLLADKLVKDVAGGADFEALAKQFSGSQGVDEALWVKEKELDSTLSEVLKDKKPGEVAGPVQNLSSLQIIKLYESRMSREAVMEADAEVALKDINLKLKPDAGIADANLLLTIARSVMKNPGSCADKGIANISGLEEADIAVEPVRATMSTMPEAARNIVKNLGVGEISEPFATPEGLRLVMLCERIDLPISNMMLDKIRNALFQEKLALEAAKYMRNMRREAFIDIRV